MKNNGYWRKRGPMALEFGVSVKVLEEHIEILKQELLFAMTEHKPEKRMMAQEIITTKKELDKAIQERMRLNQIYCSHNSSVVLAVPA
jgi:hypothetical protein